MLFLAYFRVSQKKNIKQSPNGMKPSGELLLERKQSRRLGPSVKKATRRSRGWRARPSPWARPLPRGAPVAPPTYFLHPYISSYPKTSRTEIRSGVPPPEASVATKNQSRPVPAPCRRGQSFSGGHLHHPGSLHDEEGVVLPWAEGMYQ